MTYTADKIQPDKNISMLFKSPPGFGKTIAAVSMAVFGDVWLAYFDKKVPIEIFTYFKKYRPELLPRIHVDTYTSANANAYLNKLDEICEKEQGRYVALITDSVTSITSSAIGWSMGFRGNDGPIANSLAGSDSIIPGFDDYKVETSFAIQALDRSSSYPGFNIWTAHPLISLDVKAGATGNIQAVSTKQTLVSYGNKVGQLVPGRFQEIYHFARQAGKRVVWTDAAGDDYAKTSYFGMPKQLDITDKLFAEVWRESVNKCMEAYNEVDVKQMMTGEKQESKWKV